MLFRRPLELRADDPEDLVALLREVLIDAIADLLGLDPNEIDPG